MRGVTALLLLLALGACRVDEKDTDEPLEDLDGDGYDAEADCDDADPDVHPGADELCNGLDDDCDGATDEDAVDSVGWYHDDDADGYGTGEPSLLSCSQPEGFAAVGGDCDDTDAAYNPGATEDDCTDPSDYDCSGDTPLYWDDDADGTPACVDCNDSDPSVHPGAEERCNGADDDCDNATDEDAVDAVLWQADGDGDGWGAGEVVAACDPPGDGWVDRGGDCNDTAELVHPEAEEDCDPVDRDCDGDPTLGAVDGGWWYPDGDGDGYGALTGVQACAAPAGHLAVSGDCDDTIAAVSPAALERCNGVDDDCDGITDEDAAVDAPAWHPDGDGDGYGDATTVQHACAAPGGWMADGSDCDDGTSAVHPGADEWCDGTDTDCDGARDEDDALDAVSWYTDFDGDGYGDPATEGHSCAVPAGRIVDGTDCDDTRSTVHPGATEHCDGVDEDCAGDGDAGAVDPSDWYADGDGDGFGAGAAVTSCDAPDATWSLVDGDCDDSAVLTYPGADEWCDGVDTDCDGTLDEDDALDAPGWYLDGDGDGYGAGAPVEACAAPAGRIADGSDCDDSLAGVHPGATEHCDGVDEDCAGDGDAGAVDRDPWYADGDGDGHGAGAVVLACDAPAGHVASSDDCDDSAVSVYPGADEWCDGVDTDCDGTLDEDDALDVSDWYGDGDGDGYVGGDPVWACAAPAGHGGIAEDCDDSDATIYPGATEHCDGVDEDCAGDGDAGAVDPLSWYADGDGDGYGTGAPVVICEAPSGHVRLDGDCDDTTAAVSPGVVDTCDGVDNDCSGNEDGLVTHVFAAGGTVDLSAAFASGAAGAPASVTTSDAGTIHVCPGTYHVAVTALASSLDVVGVYGRGSTVLSGGGAAPVFTMGGTGGALHLEGLTLTEGMAARGGAVDAEDPSATLTFMDCLLTGDTATGDGGAVFLTGGTATLTRTELSGNDAEYGGALAAYAGSVELHECDVFDNTAAEYGGGLYSVAATLVLDTSTVSGNTANASYAGGGGGIFSQDADVDLIDTVVSGNSAPTADGGGVFLNRTGTLYAESSEVSSNTASDWGGGFCTYEGAGLDMVHSLFLGNTAVSGGGAFMDGGAASCVGSAGVTAGFHDNEATDGGGVFLYDGATLSSVVCDWGRGSTDNTPDDVASTSFSGDAIDDATFTCTDTGCP